MKTIILISLMVLSTAKANTTMNKGDLREHWLTNMSIEAKPFKARGLISPLKKYCQDYLGGVYDKVDGCLHVKRK